MPELHCADLGMACHAKVKAATAEELIEKVAEHAAKRHKVEQLNQTLIDYAVTKVRGLPAQGPAAEGAGA